jgi:hypothetical protein
MFYLNSDFDKKKASRLLVKYGFVNGKGKANPKFTDYWKEEDNKKRFVKFEKITDDECLQWADMEVAEISKNEKAPTGYPSTDNRHVLGIQDPNKGILENVYFWILGHMTEAWSMNQVYKVVDSFAGSSQSSFFGAGSQRLSIIQDRVSNTLQTIGALTKDMFPQIHELHIWDERQGWYDRMKEGDKAADMTLKGIWIDLIEGGTENPGSVYGLAAKVGFAILPDLFFNTFVESPEKVDEVVDKDCADYNKEVRNILKRKLFQYTRWRIESEREVRTRRRFLVRYLRQHFHAIKMYMGWVKPYLKQMKFTQQNADFNERPELINAFEGSVMEIEILATKLWDKKFKPVALLNFYYTTKPEMNITDPTYQHRGPMHGGEVYVTFRAYSWTQDQIDNYRKMRDEEDFELLKEVDGGFKAALDEMGEDLVKYIEEIGPTVLNEQELKNQARKEQEEAEAEAKAKKKGGDFTKSAFEPFIGVFGGFKDLFGPLIPFSFDKKQKTPYKVALQDKENKSGALKNAKLVIKMALKNYRKAHKMITW